MNKINEPEDLLWKNISELPYFRGFLRSIEANYFQSIALESPVLDLGCGDGHFGARTFSKKKILGIDPSYSSLIFASSYKIYSGLICTEGNHLPFKTGSFKTVISNSVLEHIPDVDSVIVEASRILPKGGIFIITVPNSNFSDNLSIALFLDKVGFKRLGKKYRKLFNRISRHYHPDPQKRWLNRFENTGFTIINTFNYFPPSSLKILEWGHFFGLPWYFNFKIFNRWVLNPSIKNIILKRIYDWLYPVFLSDQESLNGAYTFIFAKKL